MSLAKYCVHGVKVLIVCATNVFGILRAGLCGRLRRG